MTPGLSFDHNLCFKCTNESYEPILDIYVSIAFQWYKEFFNPLGFDPCNLLLKIWKPIGIPTPKMRAPWECEGSFPHTLLHSREHEMWLLGFLLARILASPCFNCEPKARAATICITLFMGMQMHWIILLFCNTFRLSYNFFKSSTSYVQYLMDIVTI